jgi:hypothetical protein
MGSKAPSDFHLIPRGYLSCVNCGVFKFNRNTNYTENTLIYMAFKSGGEAVMVVPSTGMMEKFHTCRRISE